MLGIVDQFHMVRYGFKPGSWVHYMYLAQSVLFRWTPTGASLPPFCQRRSDAAGQLSRLRSRHFATELSPSEIIERGHDRSRDVVGRQRAGVRDAAAGADNAWCRSAYQQGTGGRRWRLELAGRGREMCSVSLITCKQRGSPNLMWRIGAMTANAGTVHVTKITAPAAAAVGPADTRGYGVLAPASW